MRKFIQICATDKCLFALDDRGDVWGTRLTNSALESAMQPTTFEDERVQWRYIQPPCIADETSS
jgi:hypothetical protein